MAPLYSLQFTPQNTVNECTKVQNPRRTRVRESLKPHALDILITLTGSIQKTLGKRWRLNRKKLAVVFGICMSKFCNRPILLCNGMSSYVIVT